MIIAHLLQGAVTGIIEEEVSKSAEAGLCVLFVEHVLVPDTNHKSEKISNFCFDSNPNLAVELLRG